uniref:Uncharacterized protein n=1 Tax=Arundo donax TaxID=35708 RepID=A0A0A8XTT0_ARUDO
MGFRASAWTTELPPSTWPSQIPSSSFTFRGTVGFTGTGGKVICFPRRRMLAES